MFKIHFGFNSIFFRFPHASVRAGCFCIYFPTLGFNTPNSFFSLSRSALTTSTFAVWPRRENEKPQNKKKTCFLFGLNSIFRFGFLLLPTSTFVVWHRRERRNKTQNKKEQRVFTSVWTLFFASAFRPAPRVCDVEWTRRCGDVCFFHFGFNSLFSLRLAMHCTSSVRLAFLFFNCRMRKGSKIEKKNGGALVGSKTGLIWVKSGEKPTAGNKRIGKGIGTVQNGNSEEKKGALILIHEILFVVFFRAIGGKVFVDDPSFLLRSKKSTTKCSTGSFSLMLNACPIFQGRFPLRLSGGLETVIW